MTEGHEHTKQQCGLRRAKAGSGAKAAKTKEEGGTYFLVSDQDDPVFDFTRVAAGVGLQLGGGSGRGGRAGQVSRQWADMGGKRKL